MKEKLIGYGKIIIVMVRLFIMAYFNVFPIYWRCASGLWFLLFAVSLLDELYHVIVR